VSAVDAARADNPDDLTLVAAVRAGDERAFEVLYGRYRSRITGYAQGMVGDWARAEDVTQEVFISALRRMRETDRPIAFRPWIFEIAKNACIDQFRRSKRTEEVPWETDDGEGVQAVNGGETGATPRTPESAAESSEQLEHLRGAFGALSQSHHEILVLRELDGLSYREIGDRMGLSRPGVESTLFRARRRLTEEYDDLSTGRSCARMETMLVAAEQGALGIREHRRLARHVAWCRPCRRQARLAGVAGLMPAGAVAKIAAFLPLPVVDLVRRVLGGGGGGGVGGAAASAAQSMDAMTAGWSKAAIVVAALATAGAGAGAVHEVSSAPRTAARTPAPRAGPAAPGAARPAGGSVTGGDGAAAEKVAPRARRDNPRTAARRRAPGSSTSAAQAPTRPGTGGRAQAGGGPSGSARGDGGGANAPTPPSGSPTTPSTLQPPPMSGPTVRVPTVKVPPVVVPGLPPLTVPPVTVPPVTLPPVKLPDLGGVVGGAGRTVKGVIDHALGVDG